MAAFNRAVKGKDIREAVFALGRIQDADWTPKSLEGHRSDFTKTLPDILRLANDNPGLTADGFIEFCDYVERLFLGLRSPHLPWGSLEALRRGLKDFDGESIEGALERLEEAVQDGAMARPRQLAHMQAFECYAQDSDITLGTTWEHLLREMESGSLMMEEEPEEMCAWCMSHLSDDD